MKRLLLFLLVLLLSVSTYAEGLQEARTLQAEVLYLGSKTPYPEPGNVKYTAPPAGYSPTFIYVAGRHGSRNLSGFKYDKTWLELLDIAGKSGQLTEMGKALQMDIQKIADFETGRYALLTSLGKKELFNIGKRTGENFKELFATGKPVFADATVVDRAQESRDGFLEGLKTTGYSGKITSIFYKQDKDPYLRPYDIASKYIEYDDNGDWNKAVENYSENDKAKAMAERVCSQFFTPAFLARLDSGEFKLVDLKKKTIIKSVATAAKALYELYIIGPSLKDEGLTDVNMGKYFQKDELQMFERIQVAKEFNSQGPGAPDSNNISLNIMAPLVKRMINEVDSSLSSDSPYIGVFSFAHAETQIPLVGFLEIEGSCIPYADVSEAVQNWNTADFGPMGGNIQWIVYTKNSKEPLIKMLLLEKETAFAKALKPVSGPYYKWADVKAYYGQKVQNLGIELDSSMDENIESLIKYF